MVGNVSAKAKPAPALALMPEGRTKKERFFPSVTPLEPRVAYSWDAAAPQAVAEALGGLLDRVTRLGHSSSLVSCRLRDDTSDATYIPAGDGTTVLRWIQNGQLAALEAMHGRHMGAKPRSLPFQGIRYRSGEKSDAGSDAAERTHRPDTDGEWIVFELRPEYRRMSMTMTLRLTEVLRDALLCHALDPMPEGLSGHSPDGRPTTVPHVSFLALPNVGYKHSDGRIMGLAVSLPRGLDEEARTAALRGIGRWERQHRSGSEDGEGWLRLTMGGDGVVDIKRRRPPFALVSLRRDEVWARRSRRWVSATPVALPTHPGNLHRGKPETRAKAWARAEEAVAKSCEHVGLPRPVDVQVSLSPYLNGSRPAAHFPAFRQGGGRRGGVARRLLHASVGFSEPVEGPLVLGSGRYLGLGLMRPSGEPDDGNASGRGSARRSGDARRSGKRNPREQGAR